MDIAWFTDLGHLAGTGNFSRAAKLSHISQPAFSRRIKSLESWVGTDLVDRSTHPIALTLAGQQILEAGQQAIDRLTRERDQIRDVRTQPDRYVVTFGTQHSIGWRFYPDWLQLFEASYGPMMSRLRADNLENCVEALADGEVDFVIAYASRFADGVEPLPTLESIQIGEDVLLPVTRATSDGTPLFDFSDPESPQIPYLRFGSSAPITRHVDPLIDSLDIRSRLGIVYENAMAGALRLRAREGTGVAWLPKTLIQPDLDAGLLIETGMKDWSIALGIRLYRLRQHENRTTRGIWNHVRESHATLSAIVQ